MGVRMVLSRKPILAPSLMSRFSIVIPVYCNEPSLRSLHQRLAAEAAARPEVEHEFVFVDDGSEDGSFAVLEELARADVRVRVLKLTRNFGAHSAVLAGLGAASGDCAAVIAADLQEPADLPWRLFERWSPQTPVVIATRQSRDERASTIAFARVYHATMRRLAFPKMPAGGFDCFLIDRRVITQITTHDEHNATLAGLVLWTGFHFDEVSYDRLRRPHGRSRWTLAKKLKLFVDTVVGFSYAPVRAMSLIGIFIGLIGFAYALLVVVRRVTHGEDIAGWSSLMAAIMVLSGVQLIGLGILGEYVWRTLDAARRRPTFIVEATRNIEDDTPPRG